MFGMRSTKTVASIGYQEIAGDTRNKYTRMEKQHALFMDNLMMAWVKKGKPLSYREMPSC